MSLFSRIVNRQEPAKIFFENEEVIIIKDLYPKAPVHLLIIPKKETRNFYETPYETLEMLSRYVKKTAELLGVEDRFRIIVNNGYGQEIDHIHYHFLSDMGTDKLKFIES